MKKIFILLFSLFLVTALFAQSKKKYVLVLHGGAGTILKSSMTPEKEALYKQALQNALNAGNAVLKNNGTALDAAVAAVKILE